jgi:hypothetical protein
MGVLHIGQVLSLLRMAAHPPHMQMWAQGKVAVFTLAVPQILQLGAGK